MEFEAEIDPCPCSCIVSKIARTKAKLGTFWYQMHAQGVRAGGIFREIGALRDPARGSITDAGVLVLLVARAANGPLLLFRAFTAFGFGCVIGGNGGGLTRWVWDGVYVLAWEASVGIGTPLVDRFLRRF
jgi:hypothetical protein